MKAALASTASRRRAGQIDKSPPGSQAGVHMICPACGLQLAALGVEGLVVDVCRGGCGGIWFDNFELNQVDGRHEKLGEALTAIEFDADAVVLRDKRPCPKCTGITMLQHKFSREKPVTVDECPNCGGMWLDGGELAEIRRPVTTAAERREATQAFFSRLATAELAQLRNQRARL